MGYSISANTEKSYFVQIKISQFRWLLNVWLAIDRMSVVITCQCHGDSEFVYFLKLESYEL